ncbi:hypothetical protein Tco_0395005, partial [Tanacetum coccineum]
MLATTMKMRCSRGQGQSESCWEKERSKASGSSNVNEDALARLMVADMTTQEKAECLAFLE